MNWLTKISLITFCLLSVHFYAIADPNKQALKYIGDGLWKKAEEQIVKSFEKDSINPGGHYISSLLLFQPLYEKYDIDSSYYHSLIAVEQWDEVETKEQDKLKKIGVDSFVIASLKTTIEELAFKRASNNMKLEAFEYFLSNFQNDSLSLAMILLRDSLAFSQAAQANKWENYKSYYDTYPKSLNALEALSRYHALIYREQATSQPLSNLESFLSKIPYTPYRKEIEKEILLKYTILNNPYSYLKFLDKYPDTVHKSFIIGMLFHISQDNRSFVFPSELMSDSLKRIQAKKKGGLIPFLDDNKYGFFLAEDGSVFLKGAYQNVSKEYLCELIHSSVLLVQENNEDVLISAVTGKEIIRSLDNFQELFSGAIQFQRNGKQGVVLLSGEIILPAEFEKIQTLNDQFIVVSKNGKKGLFSVLGQQVLSFKYDDYKVIGNSLLTVVKGNKIAIVELSSLKGANVDEKQLNFLYEEVELFENSYILAYSGDSETLLDLNLKSLIPLQNQEIHLEGDFIYTKSEWGFKLYDFKKRTFSEDFYQNILIGSDRIALKANNKWNLFLGGVDREPLLNVDSVYFLNDYTSIISLSGAQKLVFREGKEHLINQEESVEVILNNLNNLKTDYLLIRQPKNRVEVLTKNGISLFKLKADKILFVNDSTFIQKLGESVSLINREGENLLNDSYELIESEIQNESLLFHLLSNGKLGIYNPKTEVHVKPGYVEKLKLLNDSVYVAKKQSGIGLINYTNKNVSKFDYEGLEVLNDSLVLIKNKGFWHLKNINSEEVVLEDIVQIAPKVDYGSFFQIKFRQKKGYGLLDSRKGVFMPGLYNEILNLGTQEEPYFFVERFLQDSGFYIILYVNKNGEKVKSMAYDDKAYQKMICE